MSASRSSRNSKPLYRRRSPALPTKRRIIPKNWKAWRNPRRPSPLKWVSSRRILISFKRSPKKKSSELSRFKLKFRPRKSNLKSSERGYVKRKIPPFSNSKTRWRRRQPQMPLNFSWHQPCVSLWEWPWLWPCSAERPAIEPRRPTRIPKLR